MGLTKSFLHPYSRKENSLDCVERSYTKCPESLDRIQQKKENQRKKPHNCHHPRVLLLYPTHLCNWRSLVMEHLLSFRIKHAILKRTAHFTKLFACGLCERVSYSAAWIVFCYNLAQLYLTAKGAKSSSVFRHICDVIPYAGTVYLLCDVVCICPSRSFLSLSSSATRLFFFSLYVQCFVLL